MSAPKQFDGSRRHILDWVETPTFLDVVRNWVRDQALVIPDEPIRMPKSWTEPNESKLFDATSPFLPEIHKARLRQWWLAHAGIANIQNWDLIVSGVTATKQPALVLVEAKAHMNEFDCKPKPVYQRETAEAQKRTDDNHDRIGQAIDEASRTLANIHAGIRISRDRCYQFSNRLAMAWKLATMGISNALVFLGFTGDREIAAEGKYFADDKHWQYAFADYASSSFPLELLGRDIPCGPASFRVISRSLPVVRLSRPIAERRIG